MFILHSSNKSENLVAHLTTVMATAPLASPFEKEVFLIQSQGMERWLSQQLATHFEVWGNYLFLFPGKFFSSLAQRIDSTLNDSQFDRSQMLWRIEAALRRLDDDAFLPLKQYLSGENTALKRYQLARQLAQIFDQYQMMRPDMLTAWQNGDTLYHLSTEAWQKLLWQKISAQTGNQHRGSLWLDAISKFNNAEEGALSPFLPERISVFGINTMPPLFLSFLSGLSKHCQLHLFLLNPAQTFWADLPNKRQISHDERLIGHPLLSALGQQGREFQELLLENVQFDFEPESFEPYDVTNNLHQLQNDILNNRIDGFTSLNKDDSISIHSCHSRMREVEVLKNQLLYSLENDPDLELRDIVVMAPDIQAYEPFISAVFSDIQHAIADRSLSLSNDALDAFVCFLELTQSRFGWRSVLDLLERPVVYPGFGLTETDLELIENWLESTHVRWGKSAKHRQELGLPEFNENTWQASLDRLLMGYAVGIDDDFIDGILPYPEIEGSSALALGGLCAYMQLLFKASTEFKQPKTLDAWRSQLYFCADQFLTEVNPPERQQLNELLAELSTETNMVHDDTIELTVIVSWLKDKVAERKSANGFLRGQLTFCSMLPMRSIPFKVIALVGMNEGEFPKIDRNPTFDLLTHNFRKGDRSRRADDRYQFLEILLSTRQQLIITYIGQSISQNQAIPPSMVINELLEVLLESYQLTDLVIQHPLQPFSPLYFNGTPRLFSFSEADCETARLLFGRKPEPSPWWHGSIDVDPEEIIDLNELFNFFRHPQRFFLRKHMGVHFRGIESATEEREPFALQELDAYSIYHEWIQAVLRGKDFSVKKLQAQGRWLPGALGKLEFDRQQGSVNEFVSRIKTKNLGVPLEDLSIDLKIRDYRLVGKLENRYENGSLFYRYANLKGKDFICAWLHHLIINQIQEQTTILLSSDEDLMFLPNYCQAHNLPAFLDIYLMGNRTPNAFFVEAAFAYIKQVRQLENSNQARKLALEVAMEQLFKDVQQPYEPELKLLYQHVTDLSQILDPAFEQRCRDLLQPAWNAAHQRS